MKLLLPGEVNCVPSSCVETEDFWRPKALIKVCTPDNVADGTVGRRNPPDFIQSKGDFRDTCPKTRETFFGEFFLSDETKKERKAVKETSSTAMQASTCCQKTSHVSSMKAPFSNPETRTRATTHITKLKQRDNPSINFCRKRILTFHKRRTGIAMTSERSV